jgi:hypothetical protein
MRVAFRVMMLLMSALVGAGGPFSSGIVPHSVSASPVSVAHTSVITHGLLSTHVVRIVEDCNLGSTLGADVRNGRGQIVYPRAMDFFRHPCSGAAPGQYGKPLRPGGRLVRRPLVVLFGSWIRPIVTLTDGTHPGTEWHGRTVRIVLFDAPPLQVSQHTEPNHTFADIHPPAHVSGPLYYIQSTSCRPAGSLLIDSQPIWTAAFGDRVQPACNGVTTWHVVAGWLNHPVATIDYREPKGGKTG